MTPSPPPVCPYCGAGNALPAVAEERGAESPSLVVTAGLLVVGAMGIAAAALLLGGWLAWLLSAVLLLALWGRARAHREETAAADGPPLRWYCPDCERTFPA